MSELPRFVYAQVSKGRTYYYFNAAKEPYRREYVRMPDIADPAFEAAYADLLVGKPIESAPMGTPRAPDDRLVYFISGATGGIKIGCATDPIGRLVTLQCGSPIPLKIMAVADGGAAQERAYHKRFASVRLHGEWFDRDPEILAEIDRLNRSEVAARTNRVLKMNFKTAETVHGEVQ